MLTDRKIKQLKPKDKPYKVTDERGLVILVHPNGSKYWRLQYRFNKKQKSYAIGVYPDISLKSARLQCDEARLLISKGIDPVENRKQKNAKTAGQLSFESLAAGWMNSNRGWSENYRKDVRQRLNSHVIPLIGNKNINEIKRDDLIQIIERVKRLQLHSDTIKKIFRHTASVMNYAIAHGSCERNLVNDILPLLPSGDAVKHRVALKKEELPLFLRKLENYGGRFETIVALKLLIWTAARPGEVQQAMWQDFDLENASWTIPAERIKMRRDHTFPLPHQAITVLKQLQGITGHRQYLFPVQSNRRSKNGYMSENTLKKAIKNMGFDADAHGMRSTFSTLMNESGFNPDAIEAQMAHKVGGQIRNIYNRAQYLDERREIIQTWADYLDDLKNREKIT